VTIRAPNSGGASFKITEVDIVTSECAPDGADKTQTFLEAFAVPAENATIQ